MSDEPDTFLLPRTFANVYDDPNRLIDAAEAAQWMFYNPRIYYRKTRETRRVNMARWLAVNGVTVHSKLAVQRGNVRTRVNHYRLGDVVEALCVA